MQSDAFVHVMNVSLYNIIKVNIKTDHIASKIKQPFSFRNWFLNLGEVVALGIVVAFASAFFTNDEAFEITISIVVAYLVPRFVYSTSKLRCDSGQWLLLIVGLALAAYAIISIKSWTVDVGGSFEYPCLRSDDGAYYRWALFYFDGRCPEPKVGFKGVSIMMVWLWKALGVSIVWPIAFNYMFIMLSIVVTGKLAVRLFENKFDDINTKIISVLAMLIVSLLGFLLSQSLKIQKEAACTLGIVLVGYVLAGMSQIEKDNKRIQNKDIALFVLGCLILAFVRISYAYFAVIGAIMMGAANHHKRWKDGVLLCCIALGITLLFSFIFNYSFGQQYRTVAGGESMAKAFKITLEQQSYSALIGDYYYYPIWKRVLLLPVTAGVQFFIPFPWIYEHFEINALSIFPRFRFMWYFVGGVCIFYYLYISILHNKQNHLGVWSWWPLVIFIIIAYITGGTVSRYILPLQPLFAVIALYVILKVWKGNFRRLFLIWICVYIFFISALLIVCYHVQHNYLISIKAL